MNKIIKLTWLAPLLGILSIACGLTDPSGENKVETHLIKPIIVNLEGNVIAVETREPLAGLIWYLAQKTKGGDQKLKHAQFSGTDTTDKDGFFRMKKVSIDVEQFDYFLVFKDPNAAAPTYATSDTTFIYSAKDATLEYRDIPIFLANAPHKTTLVGTVREALDRGDAIPGARVLLKMADGTVPYTALTDSSGRYSIQEVPVGSYTLLVMAEDVYLPLMDASGGPILDSAGNAQTKNMAFVSEEEEITLRRDQEQEVVTDQHALDTGLAKGTSYLPMTTIFMLEQIDQGDLRMVLDWGWLESTRTNSEGKSESIKLTFDLDINFSVGGGLCNINYLRGYQIKMGSSDPINPSSKFGAGTCYWPEFLGGEPGDNDRMQITGKQTVIDAEKERLAAIASANGLTDQSEIDEYVTDALKITKSYSVDTPEIERQDNGDAVINEITGKVSILDSEENVQVAQHLSESADGNRPEVVTFYKNTMLTMTATDLGYYYEYTINDQGDTVRHYPVAVAVVYVKNASDQLESFANLTKEEQQQIRNIFASKARIKVYEKNHRLAKFNIPELFEVDSWEDNVSSWNVLLIEYGFKRSDVLDPAKDIYFRVIPFEALDGNTQPEMFAYSDPEQFSVYDTGTYEDDLPMSTAYTGIIDGDNLYVAGLAEECDDQQDSCYGVWVNRPRFNPKTFEFDPILREWARLADGKSWEQFPRTARVATFGWVYDSIFAGDNQGNIYDLYEPEDISYCVESTHDAGQIHTLYFGANNEDSILYVGTDIGLFGLDLNIEDDSAYGGTNKCSNKYTPEDSRGDNDGAFIGPVAPGTNGESPIASAGVKDIKNILRYKFNLTEDDTDFFHEDNSGFGKDHFMVVSAAGGSSSLYAASLQDEYTDVSNNTVEAFGWQKAFPGLIDDEIDTNYGDSKKPDKTLQIETMAIFVSNLFLGTDDGIYYYSYYSGEDGISLRADAENGLVFDEKENHWYQIKDCTLDDLKAYKTGQTTYYNCFPRKDSESGEKVSITDMKVFKGKLFVATDAGLWVIDPEGADGTKENPVVYQSQYFPRDVKINSLLPYEKTLYIFSEENGVFFLR